MPATTGANNAVATKTGLALEVYAATIARFAEVNVFKELCTVKTISGGYSSRFDVRGGGTSSNIRQHALGAAPTNTGLSLNKRNIEVERTFYDRKFIDNWEKKATHMSLLEVAVEENADSMAEFVDEKVLEQIDATMDLGQLLAEDGSGRVVQDTASVVDKAAIGTGTTTEAKGDAILEALFEAGAALNRKKQKGKARYAVLTPELYTTLVLSQKALNADYNDGSNGSIKEGNVMKINGMKILTSNNIETTGLVSQGTGNALNGKTLAGWVLTEDVIGITEFGAIETSTWYEQKDKGNYVDIDYAFGTGSLNPASLVAVAY